MFFFFRVFRNMDDDGSKGLDFNEFKKGVHDCGLSLTKEVNKAYYPLLIIYLSIHWSIYAVYASIVCLSIHLFVLYIHSYVYVSIHMFMYPFICLCIHSYVYVSIHMSMHPFICLCIHLYVFLHNSK